MASNLEAVDKIVESCNVTLQSVDLLECAVLVLRQSVIMRKGVARLDLMQEYIDEIRTEQLSIKALF